MDRRTALGQAGEELAVAALVTSGLSIVARNWRCRAGELDIVAREGGALVFCEVKSRRGSRYGPAVEAVTPTKSRRLRRLAREWLHAHPQEHAEALRFDVVSVYFPPGGLPVVEHLRGAF